MRKVKETIQYFILAAGLSMPVSAAGNAAETGNGIPQLLNAFLILAVIVLAAALLKMHFARRRDLFTDEESGMGNLAYFKRHFGKEVKGNKEYYLGYIILDSRYLRSYYNDVAYEDVIHFAAGVFRENTGENEFSASSSAASESAPLTIRTNSPFGAFSSYFNIALLSVVL